MDFISYLVARVLASFKKEFVIIFKFLYPRLLTELFKNYVELQLVLKLENHLDSNMHS